MANEEHLAILRQGVNVWNRWRVEYPDIELDLIQADLTNADLAGANLQGAYLRGAYLRGAYLRGAYLQRAHLAGAHLDGTDLVEAYLEGANFESANLTRAYVEGANLTRAYLKGTNFEGADLAGVHFTGAFLHETSLTNATVGYTTFDNLDLRNIRGLETVQHIGPSTIGIDTLHRSQGDIPEIFLRGCGVPDPMIMYARSLRRDRRPILYPSCFISYSSIDEAIANQLHTDLQAAGVRCWFAPHDLEIGEVITRGIDAAINNSDKLLIVLSEASVTSRWVEFEVSQALHRELEQGRTMLVPIRLDDTVLHTPSSWAAQLRSRHIGDFRGWKDHDHYQTAFTRLLRDLKVKDGGAKNYAQIDL